MKLARMLLATAFVASAPVWVACSSDPVAPVPVVLTGSWTGILDATALQVGLVCPFDQTITEDNNGNVTGTADLQGPCALTTFTVAGTHNTGSVPDSVELAFSDTGTTLLTFNGNFDGVDAMVGLITGSSCTGTPCPTSFTR